MSKLITRDICFYIKMGRKKNNNQAKNNKCKARTSKRKTNEEYPIDIYQPPPQLDTYIPPQMLYEQDAEKRMMPYQHPEWTDFDQQRYDSVNTPEEERSGPNFNENFRRGNNYYNTIKNKVASYIPRERPIKKQHNYLPDPRMTKIFYNGEVIEVPISMIPKKKSWMEKNGKKIMNAALASSILGGMGYGGYQLYQRGDDVWNWVKGKLDWLVKRTKEKEKELKEEKK